MFGPAAHEVAVRLPLTGTGVLGIAGDHRHRYGLARWLVAQTAVLHSPFDVRVHILCDVGTVDEWTWSRRLPHSSSVRAEGSYVNLGVDGETIAGQVAAIEAIVNARSATGRSGPRPRLPLRDEPDLVVVLDGARRLRAMPGVRRILRIGSSVGVHVICLDRAAHLLPEEACAVVLAAFESATVRIPGCADLRAVRPDLVDAAWCERVAGALARRTLGRRGSPDAVPRVSPVWPTAASPVPGNRAERGQVDTVACRL